MCKVHHHINYLLPEVKTSDYLLRKRDHHFALPFWHYSLGTHLPFAVFSNLSDYFSRC